MVKTIDIPFEKWMVSIKQVVHKVHSWLEDFFRTITTYEAIAVSAIGVGFILFIISLFLL